MASGESKSTGAGGSQGTPGAAIGSADLSKESVGDLLRLYVGVLDELRRRKVTRSNNPPLGDYTEYLVSKKLNLRLCSKSAAGFDATDEKNGDRYQIKGRRLDKPKSSTELSAIRNLPDHLFDFLIAVVYRHDFSIDYAGKIPYKVVVKRARYSRHTNAHRFHMKRDVLEIDGVVDVTARLKS